MTRLLALLPGLLLAGALGLAATTGGVSASGDEDDPCEWFIDFAEDYPELEILSCGGEWADGATWEGHGLLSWNKETPAAFRGRAENLDASPELEYSFWWSWIGGLAHVIPEACDAIADWLSEERQQRDSWRDLPMYRVLTCTIQGLAQTEARVEGGAYPTGVWWLVHGSLYDPEAREVAYFAARLSHDLLVTEVQVSDLDLELLVNWPADRLPLIPPDDPAPANAGTGLAPPGYFIPDRAERRWVP